MWPAPNPEGDGTQDYPWPGGQRLAADLVNLVDMTGRLVMDIGCGTGVLSRVALDNYAALVIATDQSPRITFQDPRLIVLVHQWGTPFPWPVAGPGAGPAGPVPAGPRLLLGGDITYRPDLFPPLLATLADCLSGDDLALLGDPRRSIEPAFFHEAQRHGLVVTSIPRPGPYTLLRIHR